MENHNWSSIKGDASARYINRQLLPRAAYATRYYNPRGIHPSLPNYLWLEAGSNLGITSDCDPGSCGNLPGVHLVDLLDRHRISWMAYEESAPSSCPTANAYPYATKHDPFVYFRDVTGDRGYCRRHVVPLTRLFTDLAHGAVARYNFITPNLCHDMHDPCGPTNDPVAQGDRWLARLIPRLTRSPAYIHGGAIFITWDEGEGGDGPIGLIVSSRDGKGHGYNNRIAYSAGSTLRTIEEIFHVRPLLRGARHAADLRDLFTRFP
jgi:phosphatidylinositol-3-phosphatase